MLTALLRAAASSHAVGVTTALGTVAYAGRSMSASGRSTSAYMVGSSYILSHGLSVRLLASKASSRRAGKHDAQEAPSSVTEGQKRELHSVDVALGANSLIFVAKTAAWFASGGTALLAEAVHSLADIGNQALLRLGIMKAAKKPTPQFPYGHLRDKFIFSLISAVGIFCLGAGVSIVNGVHAILVPAAHHDLGWGLAVLLFSTLVEGYTLAVAVRAVMANAAAAQMSVVAFIRSGRDPVSVAIMAEDGAAVAGVVIAGVCTKLVEVTGQVVWDGIGSILVGCLLAGVAVYLIQRNRSFLIGRAMKRDDFRLILAHLRNDPVIANIYDAKSEEIGENIYRFTADVDFEGSKLIGRYLDRQDITNMRARFRDACVDDADPTKFEDVMKTYGADVVSAVGTEVDRIEQEIMQLVPGVKYVDLETDRGRFSGYTIRPMDELAEEEKIQESQPPKRQ